jgi:uncharacterized 2Fe-2S/4Fe-4S cluster protein (DUF4445 family)
VRIVSGQITGDEPDKDGWALACAARPVTDITIACPESGAISGAITGAFTGAFTGASAADGSGSPAALPVKKPPRHAGAAIDIGTTTVSARLVDLDTGAPLETVSELNDQRAFGADVMSRIGAARQGRTADLFTAVNRQTGRILRFFMERRGLKRVERLTVSGNTTMLHLFLNTDPSGMGEVPFTPAFLGGRELRGKKLALPAKTVTVLPSISAFVGGDITAGLAALDILNAAAPTLLIDIGTNGEMALFNPAAGRILCCSTAAGPAFEGAEISCGLGGVPGAVSGVAEAETGLRLTTIGNAPPRGVCGSGLIDAVAVMLNRGVIDETGYMDAPPDRGFPLAENISIINRDVRQFQLAKSAILTGVKILCKTAGLPPADVRNVLIAGSFGGFISRRSAVRAGLFPPEFLERIMVCGNLSLCGAEAFLTERKLPRRAADIIARCEVVDLARDPAFADEFAANMLFE